MGDFSLDFSLVNDEDHNNVYPSSFYQLFHTSSRGESVHSAAIPPSSSALQLYSMGPPSERNRPPRFGRVSRDYYHTRVMWANCVGRFAYRMTRSDAQFL